MGNTVERERGSGLRGSLLHKGPSISFEARVILVLGTAGIAANICAYFLTAYALSLGIGSEANVYGVIAQTGANPYSQATGWFALAAIFSFMWLMLKWIGGNAGRKIALMGALAISVGLTADALWDVLFIAIKGGIA